MKKCSNCDKLEKEVKKLKEMYLSTSKELRNALELIQEYRKNILTVLKNERRKNNA